MSATCHSIECCEDSPFQAVNVTTTTIYYNTEQCATVSCPGGTTGADVTKTVAAGLYQSTVSQAAADAAALDAATLAAQAELQCSEAGCDNLVPVLSGTSAAATAISNSTSAWKAFDADTSTSWWIPATESSSYWIKYDFTSGAEVLSYRIYCGAASGVPSQWPKAWTLQGSNNDTDWTTLDTRSGETDWTSYCNTYPVATPGSYRWYRLLITQAQNTGVYPFPFSAPVIAEWQMFPCATNQSASNTETIDITTGCFWTTAYCESDPYPSTITVPSSGTITKLTVTLRDVQVSSGGDGWLIVLEGPDGTAVILWGTYSDLATWDAPITVTFDDAAASKLPAGPTKSTSGVYLPTWPAGTQPAFPLPGLGPQPPYKFTLTDFVGKDSAGTWKLWVGSRLPIASSINGGWSLNISTS